MNTAKPCPLCSQPVPLEAVWDAAGKDRNGLLERPTGVVCPSCGARLRVVQRFGSFAFVSLLLASLAALILVPSLFQPQLESTLPLFLLPMFFLSLSGGWLQRSFAKLELHDGSVALSFPIEELKQQLAEDAEEQRQLDLADAAEYETHWICSYCSQSTPIDRPACLRCGRTLLATAEDEASPQASMESPLLRVTYMEALAPPATVPVHAGPERIAREVLDRATYLDLYRRVGEPVRWNQRTQMTKLEIEQLLASDACRIYVLRDRFAGTPIGFCEFDRSAFPQIELKNFGLVPEVQGRGLGAWLLATAVSGEWADRPQRIWLHTDEWDHPAAVRTYGRAGFVTYEVRQEPAGPL